MKKLILITLISLYPLANFGQVNVYKSGISLEKYVGTWVYEHNDIKFSISIHIVTKQSVRHNVMNFLEGSYTLINKEKVVYQSSDGKPLLISGNFPFTPQGADTTKVSFFFSDKVNGKQGMANIKFARGKNDEIFWWVQNTEGIHLTIKGKKKFDETFGVPTNIKMKRVN